MMQWKMKTGNQQGKRNGSVIKEGRYVSKKHDCLHLVAQNKAFSRQEVAFREKARKIGGCRSSKKDFYTGFIPKF